MKRRKPITKEMRVAYHEAGHAVVAFELDRPVLSATIVANEEQESLGHVSYGKWGKGDPDSELTPAIIHKLERNIMCSFAGTLAVAKLIGQDTRDGADDDYRHAVDAAFYLHGNRKC